MAKKKRIVKKMKYFAKGKKVVRPKNLSKKADKNELRRDFEIFAKGVQRLEELRIELDRLNISGYEAEVNVIRSKMKNVSYIPQIEKEMEILKQKINGTYRGKEKKSSDELILEIPRIESRLNSLKKEIGEQKETSKSVDHAESKIQRRGD